MVPMSVAFLVLGCSSLCAAAAGHTCPEVQLVKECNWCNARLRAETRLALVASFPPTDPCTSYTTSHKRTSCLDLHSLHQFPPRRLLHKLHQFPQTHTFARLSQVTPLQTRALDKRARTSCTTYISFEVTQVITYSARARRLKGTRRAGHIHPTQVIV